MDVNTSYIDTESSKLPQVEFGRSMRKLSFDEPPTRRQLEVSRVPDQLEGVSGLVGESVASCASFPGVITARSTAANWSSMLVLENDSPGTVGTFESPQTPHLHIALMSGGISQIYSRCERRQSSFTYRPGIGCANLNGTPVRIRWASPQNTRVGTIQSSFQIPLKHEGDVTTD